MTALLELDQLSVDLGPARLLEDVSLSLDAGESLGLVGESGCGKSMTALAIMGLLPRTARARGQIRLAGQNLLDLSERAYCRLRGRRVAMVFQEPLTALNPVQSIGYQIAEGMRLHLGLARAVAEQRTRQLLERVGLPPARFSPQAYPHQLSGGQRQRVVIAIALACAPQVLIADEPTTALDVTLQAQILDLIAEIVDESRMGLLLISHDLGVVAEMTDRVAVMYAGRVVEASTTAALFGHLAHPYSVGLFQAMPQMATLPGTRLATIPGTVPDPRHKPLGCVFADRCARVQDVCRSAFPPPVTVGPQHTTACYFPVAPPR